MVLCTVVERHILYLGTWSRKDYIMETIEDRLDNAIHRIEYKINYNKSNYIHTTEVGYGDLLSLLKSIKG